MTDDEITQQYRRLADRFQPIMTDVTFHPLAMTRALGACCTSHIRLIKRLHGSDVAFQMAQLLLDGIGKRAEDILNDKVKDI